MPRLTMIAFALLLAACSPSGTDQDATDSERVEPARSAAAEPAGGREIAPGLTARMLRPGDGATAEVGDIAVVHYTGWLYDESAADNRGRKFDSSRDRGQHFEFPLGAGRVIRGWDLGVAGMQVGELRELTIAPELAYGERGAGNLIPPGATLVCEVELAEVKGENGGN